MIPVCVCVCVVMQCLPEWRLTRLRHDCLRGYNGPARQPTKDFMPLDRDQVIAALRTVQDPELFKDIVTLNMVKDVKVDGPRVDVHVELTTPACPLKDVIQKDVTSALRRI